MKCFLSSFQEARGARYGAEWYVDNIFEELDSLGEWFYDEKTMMLYFAQNGTSLPEEGVAPILEELISIMGTQDQPVINITIANLTLAHSTTTYLSSYEVPSGGDWSVHRGGAVFIEGAENILVQIVCLILLEVMDCFLVTIFEMQLLKEMNLCGWEIMLLLQWVLPILLMERMEINLEALKYLEILFTRLVSMANKCVLMYNR